ncbi:MAG: RusA family crossover junction endodeoxyribonuclease [Phycisphaera sp.]|nr:MAG: RusA family crossover junction endodeoxyribonuclease [Phycisphaera sp.]
MKRRICLLLRWPPTVNHYYVNTGRGSKALSANVVAFRAHVQGAVLEQEPGFEPLEGPLNFRAALWPPDRRRRDMDNLWKGTWDALKHARVIEDDQQFKRKAVLWHDEPRSGGQMLLQMSERA